MVKDDGPIKSIKDLKGGTVGVVGIKTATDLWARAGLINAGLVPDKDTKVVPMALPGHRRRRAHRQGERRHLRRARVLLCRDGQGRPAEETSPPPSPVGYDHELLKIFFGGNFLKANPDTVRAFLSDYVAVTKYYLANMEQAKTDLHKAGFVRTPLPVSFWSTDWKRDPNARVDVESLKKLSTFMLEKLQWLRAEPLKAATAWSIRATCRADREKRRSGRSPCPDA